MKLSEVESLLEDRKGLSGVPAFSTSLLLSPTTGVLGENGFTADRLFRGDLGLGVDSEVFRGSTLFGEIVLSAARDQSFEGGVWNSGLLS